MPSSRRAKRRSVSPSLTFISPIDCVTRTMSGASTTITSSSTSTTVPEGTDATSRRVGRHVSASPAVWWTRIGVGDEPKCPLARVTGSFGGFALARQLCCNCAHPDAGQISTRATSPNVRQRLPIVSCLLQNCTQRIKSQLRCMSRGFRQPADRLHDRRPLNRLRFRNTLPSCHFGNQRSASHGGNAPLGAKSYCDNAVPLDLHRKFQNVATRRILDAHTCIRVGEIAGVARMFKVIE